MGKGLIPLAFSAVSPQKKQQGVQSLGANVVTSTNARMTLDMSDEFIQYKYNRYYFDYSALENCK